MNLNNKNLFKNKAYINGEWISAKNGEAFNVLNPSDGTIVAEVSKCGRDETREAINAADFAQKKWVKKTSKERSNLLRKWFELILENKEDLALILTKEQGKPINEAMGEIIYGANYIEWFAEEAKRVYGDTIPEPSKDKRLVCIKQPVGVVACITPWNFPNAMLTRKIAPALAVGCTVVCKPANATPLSAFAFVELAEQAGIPKGVINVIAGNTSEIGSELTSNPIVRKLTFTGSTPVGKKLMAECAQTVKRTSMELGGNAPFIIFDDANIDEAVKGTIASKFRNAGQTCVCSNRILVQESVYDTFIEKLTSKVKQFKLGDGTLEDVNIGPLINENAANDVLSFVEDAKSKGAKVILGGNKSQLGPCFVEPTILSEVTEDMKVFKEEIFGPVAPILKFKTENEAIDIANKTEFGLACYFYTRDIGRVWRVSEALEYGIVGINEGAISNEMVPFGGIKESGQGREGSKYGLDDYLEIKYLCMGGIDQ